MIWTGNVTHIGERSVFKVLMGKPQGKRPLGRLRHRWEDIKMDLQEVGWGMDWIDVTQERALVHVVMNLRVV
jgi:hypothetical protein